jgi:hypothetical protein
VKTEAYFSSKKKAESGAGKFAFDEKQIIVAHDNYECKAYKIKKHSN